MLESTVRKIEWLSRKQGETTSFLVYPLLIVVVYEVIMRYVFNAPTTWGFEATTFLYGLHYMFGYAYTDVYDGHVKVDIFTARLSQKAQAVMRVITNLVFFMPVMLFLTLWSIKFAYTATIQLEVNSTSWAPPIWPIKILMALAFAFLLLQGIAHLFKDINAIREKR